MRDQSDTLTRRLVHPTSPVLLTKKSPLNAYLTLIRFKPLDYRHQPNIYLEELLAELLAPQASILDQQHQLSVNHMKRSSFKKRSSLIHLKFENRLKLFQLQDL